MNEIETAIPYGIDLLYQMEYQNVEKPFEEK